MCNFNADLENVPHDCPGIEELVSKTNVGPSFGILLDTNKYLKQKVREQKDICRVDEMFDPYLVSIILS